jgi:hypothetical protein
MLSAKLFGGLGAIEFLVAILGHYGILPCSPMGLDFAGIAYGPFYWQTFAAIVCAALALSYVGIARTATHPPNRLVGIASFALVALALLTMTAESLVSDKFFQRFELLVWIFFAAMFAFLVGVVLSALNLAWAVFRQALPASN